MSKVRVAVAGLGFMGATHIRAWNRVPEAELVAVVSSSAKKLAGDLSDTAGNLATGDSTQLDFSGLQRYTQLDQALADPAIDAIDLCVPTHNHAQSALAALQAGKHVLVEKPLARTSQEAYALVREAERTGLILMTGHVLRFFPEWHNLAQLLRASPQKVASFRRNCGAPAWSPWLMDFAASGGAPLDLLIHDSDFVLHCFGVPEKVSAVGLYAPERQIDWLSAQCVFANGNTATISGGWHPEPDYPFSMEFDVIAQSCTMHWSSLTSPPTGGDPWLEQLRHFAQAIERHTPPSLSPPLEAAQAIRLIELLVESRRNNGEWLPWTN